MRKGIIALGVALCLLAAAALFQVRIVTVQGEWVLLYMPMTGGSSGSAVADLTEALTEDYGEAGKIPLTQRDWKGREAVVYQTAQYSVSYLGRVPGGGDYYTCRAVLLYTAETAEGEELDRAERNCTCLGYDDGDLSSSIRAALLEETPTESHTGSWETFAPLVGEA